VQQLDEAQVGPADRAVEVQHGAHAGGVVISQGLALCGQHIPIRLVTTKHARGDQVPQHPIQRSSIGACRLGQLRRGSQSPHDVVGDPQGGRHAHRHRRG
jgi:hypothetical protein